MSFVGHDGYTCFCRHSYDGHSSTCNELESKVASNWCGCVTSSVNTNAQTAPLRESTCVLTFAPVFKNCLLPQCVCAICLCLLLSCRGRLLPTNAQTGEANTRCTERNGHRQRGVCVFVCVGGRAGAVSQEVGGWQGRMCFVQGPTSPCHVLYRLSFVWSAAAAVIVCL